MEPGLYYAGLTLGGIILGSYAVMDLTIGHAIKQDLEDCKKSGKSYKEACKPIGVFSYLMTRKLRKESIGIKQTKSVDEKLELSGAEGLTVVDYWRKKI